METRFSLCGLNCDLCRCIWAAIVPAAEAEQATRAALWLSAPWSTGASSFVGSAGSIPAPLRWHRRLGFLCPSPEPTAGHRQVRELGLEAYLAQLGEKRAILDALLARFNDGRRKTLFNTAVYLLPLEDLQSVMADLNSRTELAGQSVKERALAAVELVQQAADRRGVSLKLNKKPKRVIPWRLPG